MVGKNSISFGIDQNAELLTGIILLNLFKSKYNNNNNRCGYVDINYNSSTNFPVKR